MLNTRREQRPQTFKFVRRNFQQNQFHFTSQPLKNLIIVMIKNSVLLSLIISLALAYISPPPFDMSRLSTLTRAFTMAAPPSFSEASDGQAKKGTTWQVSEWPVESNSWAAKAGSVDGDGKNGDSDCTEKLPILCLIDYKTIPRPRYNFPRDSRGKSVSDGGFYNGWTGGFFAATDPVIGTDLTSRNVADKFCQMKFGGSARAMEVSQPLYMEYMNDLPNIGQKWDWSKTQAGGDSGWAFIKGSLPCGRMWTWNSAEANANCGA